MILSGLFAAFFVCGQTMKQRNDIPASQKSKARWLAVRAYRESHRDSDKAELIIRDRMQNEVGSLWVDIAITIAIALIRHWLEHSISEPSAVFVRGEPYAPTDEDGELAT